MKSINMGEQYFKGVLAGYLGANYMCGPITEWQIDIIKENISHYCEYKIRSITTQSHGLKSSDFFGV